MENLRLVFLDDNLSSSAYQIGSATGIPRSNSSSLAGNRTLMSATLRLLGRSLPQEIVRSITKHVQIVRRWTSCFQIISRSCEIESASSVEARGGVVATCRPCVMRTAIPSESLISVECHRNPMTTNQRTSKLGNYCLGPTHTEPKAKDCEPSRHLVLVLHEAKVNFGRTLRVARV